MAKSVQLLEAAIALDPDCPVAYAHFAATHRSSTWFRLSQSPGGAVKRAFEAAQQCVALDDTSPLGHDALGIVYLLKRKHDYALRKARKLSPWLPVERTAISISA